MTKHTGKKWFTYGLSMVLLLVCIAMVLAADRSTRLSVTKIQGVTAPPSKVRGMRPLRVMSFNVAHGSKNMFGVVPLFRRAKTIKKRLRAIAAFIKSHKPDVVGLQEADGPSWWSGRFHHVNFLGKHGGYPYAILGEHVKTKRKRYGAAMISRLQLFNAISHRFKPLTYFKKGVVVATIRWPGAPQIQVDVASLHLDPRKGWVQASQLREVAQLVRERKRPVIVMGDFNTTWFKKKSALKVMTKELGLSTYRPYNPYYFTHHFPKKRRIDWIFISKELKFVNHRIIKKKLTDHYPVMADIAYKLPAKTKPRPAPAKRAARPAPARPTARPAPAKRPAVRPAAPAKRAAAPAKPVAPAKPAAPAKPVVPAKPVLPAKPAAPAKPAPAKRKQLLIPDRPPVPPRPASRPASKPTSKPASRPAARR